MSAALPNLAKVRTLRDGGWSRNLIVCPECRGSGRQYLDTGPSGLTTPCNECGGQGRWPEMESDRG